MSVLLGAIWRQIPVGGFRPHADSSDDETYVPCDSDHECDCSSQYLSMLKALCSTIISEIIENSKR